MIPLGQVRLGQVRLGQVRLGQVRLGQVRLGQVRLGQVRLGQVRLGQVRLGQVRVGQVRLGQVNLGQVRLGQVRLGQVRLGQDRIGQVRKVPYFGSTLYLFTHFFQNAVLSMIPFLCNWIYSIVYSRVMDMLGQRKFITTTVTRKVSMAIGAIFTYFELLFYISIYKDRRHFLVTKCEKMKRRKKRVPQITPKYTNNSKTFKSLFFVKLRVFSKLSTFKMHFPILNIYRLRTVQKQNGNSLKLLFLFQHL